MSKLLPKWIEEYKALTCPAKDSYMAYDYRYSSFGVHFVSGIQPDVQAMVDAGFLYEHKNYGYMATRKGRLVADAIGLHEGRCISRRVKGTYTYKEFKVVKGVLLPVRWDGNEYVEL